MRHATSIAFHWSIPFCDAEKYNTQSCTKPVASNLETQVLVIAKRHWALDSLEASDPHELVASNPYTSDAGTELLVWIYHDHVGNETSTCLSCCFR